MPSWKKVIVSGSDASLNSLNVINGITGSLLGTSSYASNADLLDGLNSTAFVLNTQTSSFVQNSQTSSFATFTALNAYTSSINTYTSSLNTKTSSFVLNSQTSSFVQNSQTSSFATFTALNAYTSSINTYTSSLNAKTSSFATTGSNNFIGTENITGSLTISSSLPIDLTVIGGQNITGSLNVSGSTTFTGGSGTTLLSTNADTLILTGSLFTSGSSSLSGSISISGSLSVNSSNVVLTNQTSSFVLNSQTSSMSVLSASFAATASFALNTQNIDTGSLLPTSSFNAYTSSINTYTSSLNSKTSSFATTGSNTFIGNQTISGSVNISQSLNTPLINITSGSLNEGIIDINNSINSWIYSGKSFSITSQETAPVGIFFKSDGTKMYINGSSGDDINEYNLGTAWDVTTAVFSSSFSTSGQDTAPADLFFSSDGTRLYVAGDTNNTIFQYSLGTAWDISTTSYSSISFSVAAKDTNPSGIFFKSDGTKMYVCGTSSDSVHEYDLGTAWNVSTATFLQSFSLSSQDTVPASINFNNDGTKFYIVGSTNDNIYEYNLGTPWNISTAVYYSRTYVGNQEATPTGLYVTTDNVYVVGSTSDTVFQYYSNTNALRLTSDSLILNTELISTTGSVSIDQNLDIGGNAKIVGTVTAGTLSGAGSFSSLTSNSTTTLASSTAAQTVALGAGATLAATTKTINIGTSGVSTSITNVNIGSAVAGSLGTVTINSNTVVTGSLTVFSGSAIDFQVTDAGTKIGSTPSDTHSVTGSLFLSGSLTSTGTLTAQTLVVQTITSSVIYSSGSNVFGNSLANTQVLTGSVIVTGSLSVNGSNVVLTNQTSSFTLNSQTSSFVQNSQTSSFTTTSSFNSYTSSINAFSASILSYTGSLNSATSSFATSASFNAYTSSLNSKTSSFATTGSNTFNGNQIITGSVMIGSSSLGPNENSLTLGARDSANEGGQLGFNAPGGTFASASFIDNWSNFHRILRGTNASSNALVAQWNLGTLQMELPAYTSATSFVGTATANLAVDSSGKVITVSTSGGSVFPYTGNAVITGSLTATTGLISPVNGGAYLRGGDDAELWDINVTNTVGIYGQQDQTVASIKLGSGGGTISGKTGFIGINTIAPLYILDINSSGSNGARVYSGSLAVGNITPSATVGRIDASNDVVAFSTSDIRFKENINPIDNALDKLNKIGGYTFDWKTEEELVSLHGFKGHDVGVIAQEIESILPEVVTTRDSGYKAVKYEKIVPLLIQAIKEQQEQIKELQDIIKNK